MGVENVELRVVMKDVFEVPKIIVSYCGLGTVAGAINVIEKGAPVARAKVYCWVQAFGTRGGACDTQAPRNPSTKNMHACLGNGIRQEVR